MADPKISVSAANNPKDAEMNFDKERAEGKVFANLAFLAMEIVKLVVFINTLICR